MHQLRSEGGANVILDIMGAKYLDRNVDALATDGRLVIIGMQGGVMAELNIGKLLIAARAAAVTVVHCLVQRRPDGRGSNTNARLFAAGKSFTVDLTPGSAGASLIPELGPADTDIVLTRDFRPLLQNVTPETFVSSEESTRIKA